VRRPRCVPRDPMERGRHLRRARLDVKRESLLRRLAARQGLALQKSRWAHDAGTFQIIDPFNNSIVACGHYGDGYGLSLNEVAASRGAGRPRILARRTGAVQ